ncbi:unnamed protein product, partial [Heterotrigona itama]
MSERTIVADYFQTARDSCLETTVVAINGQFMQSFVASSVKVEQALNSSSR